MILQPDEMTTQLDGAAKQMAALRQRCRNYRQMMENDVRAWLTSLPTTYADVLETIQQSGYGDTDPDEAAKKALFQALNSARVGFGDDLDDLFVWWDANITEF